MNKLAPLLLFLFACSTDTLGPWTGDCTISADGEPVVYAIGLDIESDAGGVIVGTALFDVTGLGDEAEVDLDGIRKGKDVELELTVPDDVGVPVAMNLEAKVKGDEMIGECILLIGVSLRGDLELTRGVAEEQEDGTKTAR